MTRTEADGNLHTVCGVADALPGRVDSLRGRTEGILRGLTTVRKSHNTAWIYRGVPVPRRGAVNRFEAPIYPILDRP